MGMRLGAHCGSAYSQIVRRSSHSKFRYIPTLRYVQRHPQRDSVLCFSQTAYQDPTLVWAQSNPRLAQGCLNPPPAIDVTKPSSKNMMESFEAYLEWRKWNFPEEIYDWSQNSDFEDPRENAKALVSHILSAPLTLASQSKYILRQCANDDTSNGSLEFNWCSVGARAEASIPLMYWKEFLMSSRTSLTSLDLQSTDPSSQISSKNLALSLDFIGPDIPPRLPEQTVMIPDGQVENNNSCTTSISLRCYHRGFFHKSPAKDNLNLWNAYIFFNPGFGHPNLRKSWEPTLNLILSRNEERTDNKPRVMLLTAHSEHDMDRDAKILANDYGLEDVSYYENPFASRIAYEDPFEKNHFVRPNHYVATVVI